MYCKIFHIDKETKCESIIENLELGKNCNIITDDICIKYDLEKNGYECRSLSEIFPDVDPISSKIYDLTVKKIEEYKVHLSSINYGTIPIFTIIEPILRDDLVLVNKFSFLLSKKQDIIFIFRSPDYSLFLLNKLAREEDFETFHKSKINHISKNKITLISSFKEKTSFKKKLFLTFNKNSEENILKSIKDKIKFLKNQQKLTLFFLTPSTRYVLNPIFSVVEQFQKNNISNHMISFDHTLVDELKKDNFSISDFSRESLVLSSIIQNNDDGKKLIDHILNIAKEKKLELIIFENFINPKIFNIFRFIAIFEITKIILQNTNTQSLVVAFDGNSMGNAITLASTILEIPSYSICSLAIINNPLTKFIYTADKILIYGTHGYDLLQKFEYPSNKIIITGNVMYEYFSEIDYEKCKDQINKLCNFDFDKPLIVLGGRWYPNDENWISKFIKFCNHQNFNVLIKVHPLYLTTNTEIHQHMIQKIQELCHDLNFSIQIDISPSILLPAADLVITDESQLGVEAGLLGKPWITKNFHNDKERFLFEMYGHLINSVHVTNYEDLEKTTLEILIEKKHSKFIEQNKKELLKKFSNQNNDKSSEKIFSIIRKL